MVRIRDERTGIWREPTAAEKNPYADVQLPKEMISHAAWLKGTSKLFARRSPALLGVDAALKDYENDPCQLTFVVLRQKFKEWKAGKGDADAWKSSSRNDNQIVTLLDQQISGVGDRDILSDTQRFMEQNLIEARLGIVYLFSHLDCDNFFNVLVNGALDVGTAGISYGSAQLGIADKAAGIDPTKDQRISDLGTASSTLGKAGTVYNKVDPFVRKKIGNQSLDAASTDSSPRFVRPVWLDISPAPPASGTLATIWNKVQPIVQKAADEIYKLVMKKIEWLKERWADKSGTALQYLPGLIRKLADFLLGKLLASLAPFVQSGLDLAGGIARSMKATVEKYKEWEGGKSVQLLSGAPSTITQAIRTAMWMNVGEGLYDTLKGAGNLALDVGIGISAGATAIAKLVISVVETLAKTIWRLVEIGLMRGCFGESRALWEARASEHSMHRQPIAFNYWFKGHALAAPALAVLALNSGICGDKMHFLQMFSDSKNIISQSQFDAGCKYVDELKVWGAKYLSDSGFNFVSKDPLTNGLIKLAQSHKEPETAGTKALQAVLGFLKVS